MNTFAKFLAPAALVFAVFGAQAGEIAVGEIGFQPAKPGSATPVQITGQAGLSGEVAVGDLGLKPVTASRTSRPRDTMAQPIRSLYVVGA
jgi:hypothetical protein